MNEKNMLEGIIKKLESGKVNILARPGFTWLLLVVTAITLFFVMRLGGEGSITTVVVTVISFFAGFFVSFCASIHAAEKHWSFLKAYINKPSIEKRIEEIDT